MKVNPSKGAPSNLRLVCIGLAVAGSGLLALNHYMAVSQKVVYLWALALGPLVLLLGIGGIVEPKVVWSLGKHGQDLPISYRIIGGALGAVGVAITLLLVFVVYDFGPPR